MFHTQTPGATRRAGRKPGASLYTLHHQPPPTSRCHPTPTHPHLLRTLPLPLPRPVPHLPVAHGFALVALTISIVAVMFRPKHINLVILAKPALLPGCIKRCWVRGTLGWGWDLLRIGEWRRFWIGGGCCKEHILGCPCCCMLRSVGWHRLSHSFSSLIIIILLFCSCRISGPYTLASVVIHRSHLRGIQL